MSMIDRMLVHFAAILFALGGVTVAAAADEPSDEDRRAYLIDGQVIDAETGDPIESFRVVPGTPYRGTGGGAAIAVWQPHMIREMTDGVFRWPRTRGYKEMRFRVEADGYRPATTLWLGVGGPYMRLKVHLRRDPGIDVVVTKPDGSAAGQATIAIGLPNRGVRLDQYRVEGAGEPPLARLSDQWRRPQAVQTDLLGRCRVPEETDSVAVLCVSHRDGYLEMPYKEFAQLAQMPPVELQLKPWGRIDGKVYWKDKPGVGETVGATIHRNDGYPGMVSAYPRAEADAAGEYSFEYIPPGPVQVGHRVKLPAGTKLSPTAVVYEYPVFQVDVPSGQSVPVDIGGEGLTVTGQLQGVQSFDDVTIAIQPPAPDVFNWARFGNAGGGGDLQKGFAALRDSEYAPLYFRSSLPVAADGSFRIEDVMTGQYTLTVSGAATGSASLRVTSFGEDPIEMGSIPVTSAAAAKGANGG
jgi:hypothetical protein